jgi:hypothetical protein
MRVLTQYTPYSQYPSFFQKCAHSRLGKTVKTRVLKSTYTGMSEENVPSTFFVFV